MATELQFYQLAKAALAKAAAVDEVKQIHNNAAAMKAAAKVAKDKELEANAHEIRMRAERRLGELMEQQKQTVGLNKGGGDHRSEHRDSKKPSDAKPTLTEVGIGKNLAQRARNAAKPSEQDFELKITAEKEQIKSPPVNLNIVHEKRKQVTLPDPTERCVTMVREAIESMIRQIRICGAGEQKIRFLFQRLSDELRALENKTLPPKEQSAEERSIAMTKLAEEDERATA